MDASEIGNMRYILADLAMQYHRAVLAPGADPGNVAEATLLWEEACSFFTEQDPKYKTEHLQAVPKDFKPGYDPQRDSMVRMKQYGAAMRSLCRMQVFTKLQQEAKAYRPKAAVLQAVEAVGV